MSETTPNDMPGAAPVFMEPAIPDATDSSAKPESTGDATEGELTSDERAELRRLRDVHKDEQKWRRDATKNYSDAEKYRQLMAQLGGDPGKGKDFDPQAAIADLTSKFETAERERIRSEVARTEGVNPKYAAGATEDEMRASAQEFKADLQAEIDKARAAVSSSAAPVTEVTGNGKVQGPNQITSRDELKNMSPKEILAAKEEGRLDGLLGK